MNRQLLNEFVYDWLENIFFAFKGLGTKKLFL